MAGDGLGTILMNITMAMNTTNTMTSISHTPQEQPLFRSFRRSVSVATPFMLLSATLLVFSRTYWAMEYNLVKNLNCASGQTLLSLTTISLATSALCLRERAMETMSSAISSCI